MRGIEEQPRRWGTKARIALAFAALNACSAEGTAVDAAATDGAPAGDGAHADAAVAPDGDASPAGDTAAALDSAGADADAAPDTAACVPECGGLDCGPDGCGGNCGTCLDEWTCLDGRCCYPSCSLKECGPDGCGGNCGQCGEGEVCLDQICCAPNCGGRDCGPDGCGGVCGTCSGERFCLLGVCSLPDSDGDGVPDRADPEPLQPAWPGHVKAGVVYAHTADALFSLDVKTYALSHVGDFGWPADGTSHKMTDIAIDSFGVLYGIGYELLYLCNPLTMECRVLGELPASFYGLSWIPRAGDDAEAEDLVGITNDGFWVRLSVQDGVVDSQQVGLFGNGYTAAGDVYSIRGVGTYASVYKPGDKAQNYLVEVSPQSGQVLREVGPLLGYNGVFGLAGWTKKAFAFDKTGAIMVVDTDSAVVNVLAETEHPWWGAGVQVRLAE